MCSDFERTWKCSHRSEGSGATDGGLPPIPPVLSRIPHFTGKLFWTHPAGQWSRQSGLGNGSISRPLSAQGSSGMASEGQERDYGARQQSTPLSEQNPLDNIRVSLSATRRMSQFNAMVERSRRRFCCTTPSCPAGSPILCGCLGLDETNINSSGPLGQQSRPDSGDIPAWGRSLPGPRVDQEDWPWVAAVHCCLS